MSLNQCFSLVILFVYGSVVFGSLANFNWCRNLSDFRSFSFVNNWQIGLAKDVLNVPLSFVQFWGWGITSALFSGSPTWEFGGLTHLVLEHLFQTWVLCRLLLHIRTWGSIMTLSVQYLYNSPPSPWLSSVLLVLWSWSCVSMFVPVLLM